MKKIAININSVFSVFFARGFLKTLRPLRPLREELCNV